MFVNSPILEATSVPIKNRLSHKTWHVHFLEYHIAIRLTTIIIPKKKTKKKNQTWMISQTNEVKNKT